MLRSSNTVPNPQLPSSTLTKPSIQRLNARLAIVFAVTLCVSSLGFLFFNPTPTTVRAATNPPKMGVNLSGPCDYCGDFTFADAMKGARHWGSTSAPWDQAATVDANGWPTQDAGVVLIVPPDNMSIAGTYKLVFTGQASSVTGVASSVTVNNKVYNSATNITTADLVVGTNSQLNLAFFGTKRNPSDNAGTGITNVKVMLPTSFGSNTAYDPSVTFTNQAKTFLQKFSTVRYMDYSHTNGNDQVNWSNRRLPTYFSMSADGTFRGGAWEYVIQLSNETGVDPYINVPAQATDDYILQLARLFKFGSDANGNVYTSTQTNPYYKPLNSNLHLYIEYSNEVWNGNFSQTHENHNAAIAEVNAGNSPLNYDGETNDWYWAWRRVGKRIHDISEIFRGIFGSSEMPNGNGRIRPLLEWQYGNSQDTARQALTFLDNYYNNADGINHVANPHSVNYFIWGAGGAAYSGVNNPQASTIDGIYNSGYNGSVVPGTINTDVLWGRSYGIMHDVAYEGGFQIGGDFPTELQFQANLDPRAKQMEIDTQNKFNQAGGELLVYFNATGRNYGLARPSVYDINTPKMQAITQLSQSDAAAPTNGTSLPGNIFFDYGSLGKGGRLNALVINSAAATYNATLNLNTSYSANTIQVLVNNVVVQTVNTQQTSQQNSSISLTGISIPAGVSAISFKGLNTTDTVLNYFSLYQGSPIPVTPTPTAPIQQTDVAQASSAPTIDGNATDSVWSSANSNAITHVVGSPSGFSASYQSAWDNSNLYFLVKVNDATLSSHSDVVEIYIDPERNGGTSYDNKDMQYVFASNSTTVVQYNGGSQGTNTAGVTFTNKTVSGGYNVEIKIPWSTLGVTASANKAIGLDIAAVQGGTGTNKLFWSATTDTAWTNPSVFGRAVLKTSGGSAPVPAPWQSNDIGSVGQAGSTSYNTNGTFTVAGSGADIWGSSDAFRFVNQSLNGNGTIIARVTSVQNTNEWAKSGVMIRESLSPNAPYAFMTLTPSNGSHLQNRLTTFGGSGGTAGPNVTAPYWVKLQRTGNTFIGSISSDGTNWTQVSSLTISMATNAYVGLAVTSHDNTILNTSTFTNVSVNAG